MIAKTITDSDMIILQSVESYLKQVGMSSAVRTPQEKLILEQQARDYLYSDIVRRVSRVAAYIMGANLETDTTAKGLYLALSNHAMDPIFINILMQFLEKSHNDEENGIVGAFLTKIMNKYIQDHVSSDDKKKKEDNKKPDLSPIAHIQQAVVKLLGNISSVVSCRCGNLTETEALCIGACIAMNNNDTIKEIIASDLSITAQLFDVLRDPGNLITSALLLKASDYTKLTQNQSAFMESLKIWVYTKLNEIPPQAAYQYLVAVYGTSKPDVKPYYIQIKDCSTQFSNLKAVAKSLINA